MDTLLTYRGAVYPWHCDHMGHMNVMWYAGKFDEATWQLLGSLGLTAQALAAAGRGMVAAEQLTQYRAELLAGDLVAIHSRVVDCSERTIRFVHEMRNESTGVIAAISTLVGVHIDRATRKACVLPPDVQALLQARRQEAAAG